MIIITSIINHWQVQLIPCESFHSSADEAEGELAALHGCNIPGAINHVTHINPEGLSFNGCSGTVPHPCVM